MNWRKMTPEEFLRRARMEAGGPIGAGKPPRISQLPTSEGERAGTPCVRIEVVAVTPKKRALVTH